MLKTKKREKEDHRYIKFQTSISYEILTYWCFLLWKDWDFSIRNTTTKTVVLWNFIIQIEITIMDKQFK